jgi:hypothetical protein
VHKTRVGTNSSNSSEKPTITVRTLLHIGAVETVNGKCRLLEDPVNAMDGAGVVFFIFTAAGAAGVAGILVAIILSVPSLQAVQAIHSASIALNIEIGIGEFFVGALTLSYNALDSCTALVSGHLVRLCSISSLVRGGFAKRVQEVRIETRRENLRDFAGLLRNEVFPEFFYNPLGVDLASFVAIGRHPSRLV